LILLTLFATAWHAQARAQPFQRDGTYIYKSGERVLGRERFWTEETPSGFRIHSRTDLELDTYLLGQSSILEVDLEGAFQSIRVTGNSGGKRFGFSARVTGGSLIIEDTVKGMATVVEYDRPFHWIVGNFMQHLILALSAYEPGRPARQEITTQAGPLSIERLGTTALSAGGQTITVDRYRLLWQDAALQMYVDTEGLVDLIILEDQDVSIHRRGFEEWIVAPLPDGESERGGREGAAGRHRPRLRE
jgi:hypothetical protein